MIHKYAMLESHYYLSLGTSPSPVVYVAVWCILSGDNNVKHDHLFIKRSVKMESFEFLYTM